MPDKDKDAKISSIAKTLNKVEDRLEKGKNCSSVAEGLANGRCLPASCYDSITIRGLPKSTAIPRRALTATRMMRNGSSRLVLLKSHDISG